MKEFKTCEDYKDYNDFIKDAAIIENNSICPKCNSSYVTHTSPFTHTLICGDCGICFDITMEKEERKE